MRRVLRRLGWGVRWGVRIVALVACSPALVVIYAVRGAGAGWRWLTLQD